MEPSLTARLAGSRKGRSADTWAAEAAEMLAEVDLDLDVVRRDSAGPCG